MKKQLLLILIIAAFVYSCKKSGSAVNQLNSEIAGTWRFTSDSTREFVKGVQTSLSVNMPNTNLTYQFNTDGTGAQRLDTVPGSATFTYKITGSTLAFNYPAQTYDKAYSGALTDSATIGTLTSKKLEMIRKVYFYNLNGKNVYDEDDAYFTK